MRRRCAGVLAGRPEKLDAEIIDLTLVEEIEQADACKEKIQVMFFELEAALASGHGRVSTATSHGRAFILESARVRESYHTTLGPKVMLPKCTLKRFTGEITRGLPFGNPLNLPSIRTPAFLTLWA